MRGAHNPEVIAPRTAPRAVAVGGGTGGDLWPQIVSDITGVSQEIPRETIGACYGDALLAAEGAGLVSVGTTWAASQRTVAPRVEHAALYDKLYGLYRDLYVATAPIAHELAAVQNLR